MRKKFISFLVLSFFLIGCSNQKNTALENCADDGFNLNKHVWDLYDRNDEKIVGLTKGFKLAEQKLAEANKIKDDVYSKHFARKDGKIIMIYPEDLKEENYKSWENLFAARRNDLQNNINNALEDLIYIEQELSYYKKISARKVFEKLNVKKKIELISYYEEYILCEQQHSLSPNAFELKWKN